MGQGFFTTLLAVRTTGFVVCQLESDLGSQHLAVMACLREIKLKISALLIYN